MSDPICQLLLFDDGTYGSLRGTGWARGVEQMFKKTRVFPPIQVTNSKHFLYSIFTVFITSDKPSFMKSIYSFFNSNTTRVTMTAKRCRTANCNNWAVTGKNHCSNRESTSLLACLRAYHDQMAEWWSSRRFCAWASSSNHLMLRGHGNMHRFLHSDLSYKLTCHANIWS